jgi:ABC-type Fe3+/spermidine/putrescine transport system ATPase subunit
MADKLVIEDVCHHFNNQEVLSHISFTVMNGEFLSILGPSGCGKTTLLRILIGLLEPSSGQVFKDGENITRLKPSERNMGIVFQNYALFQNMTVLGNVEYALKFNQKLKQKSRSIAEYVIEQVGLTEHMYKKPQKLSGGQQQRVAIARTLALNPDIILFDEPMSALDAATRLLLRGEIKKIQQNFKSTVIYITHDQEEAFALSDRIIVMNDGVIEQMDTPENIIRHPVNQYIKDFVILNLQLKMDSLAKYMRISN